MLIKDPKAIKEHDPACISPVHCLLNYTVFLACQVHRVARKLWSSGRKVLALLIQNWVSKVLAVDIHRSTRIGHGILLDHATGLVIGVSDVIGKGGHRDSRDRHPMIGDGVLVGAVGPLGQVGGLKVQIHLVNYFNIA